MKNGATEKRAANTVTKADIVERVRDVTGLSWAESGTLVEALLETVKLTLEGGENVKISGFGTFQVRAKAARKGRNPQTAANIVIPRRRVLTFKPSHVLRDSLQTDEA